MMTPLDQDLAERFGGYASYKRDDDTVTETYGDAPAEEVDRLLDTYCQPNSCVLDLGCGAGLMLCRLAPQVKEIWGFDQEPDLLEATRQRIATLGISNARCVLGNVAVADEVTKQLPEAAFDLVLCQRGPNVTPLC